MTREIHAYNIRRKEIDGLAEHASLGLDPTDAPADDANAIDHGRVRVGADQGIGIVDPGLLPYAARQVLEVHLMYDADTRRNHLEGIERLHTPFHELVALGVALELELHLEIQGLLCAVVVDLPRVIDD